MLRSLARGAALVVCVLLVTGCGGGGAKVTDKNSAHAKACRAAIATRMNAAFAEAKPGTAEANLAMQRALSGEKPTECNSIDDALGSQLIAELGSEHDQMMADQASSTAPPAAPKH